MHRLVGALTLSRLAKGSIIFDEGNSADSAYILLSGIARITCRNRKGERIMVIMVAPGMIPGFPLPVPGIRYNFRCEAVTACQIGTVDFKTLIEISLGIASNDFKRMADIYLGALGFSAIALLQLHGLHAGGTARAGIARTGREFRQSRIHKGCA